MQPFSEIASEKPLNGEDIEKQVKPKKDLSHLKPILYLNLFSLTGLCYAAGGKHANNDFGVSVLDISFFRALSLFVMSLPKVL